MPLGNFIFRVWVVLVLEACVGVLAIIFVVQSGQSDKLTVDLFFI